MKRIGVTTLVSLVTAVWICAFAGCGSGPTLRNPTGYNVVIVLADALRADHLGCYGYHRNTSPFIDSLAASGVMFENAVTPSTYTGQAVSSLFTGELPSRLGVAEWSSRPPQDVKVLAEEFKAAGYRTGFVARQPVLKDKAFHRGFSEVFAETRIGGAHRNKHEALNAIRFIKEVSEAPFFLYVHFLAPHQPFEAPREAHLKLGILPWESPRSIGSLTALAPRRNEIGLGPGDARFEDVVARYDALIVDVDRYVREIVAALDESGRAGRTILVVVADHGEEFLEHGFGDHAYTLYQEVLHVPLIIWAPDVLRPQRISRWVSTVDLPPTLLALTGVASADAVSERNLLTTAGASAARPLISEVLMSDRAISRCVIDGRWKYISSVRWQNTRDRVHDVDVERDWLSLLKFRGFKLDYWGPVMKEELYDLTADPREERNLIVKHPSVARRLRSILDEYRKTVGHIGASPRPTKSQLKQLQRLRSLGYVSASVDKSGDVQQKQFSVPLYSIGDRLPVGLDEGDLYLPYGWGNGENSGFRWTDGEEALVWFRISGFTDELKSRNFELVIAGRTFRDQVVPVLVNDHPVGSLWPGRELHRLPVSGRYLNSTTRIVFRAPAARSPSHFGQSSDHRMLGVYVKYLKLDELKSK